MSMVLTSNHTFSASDIQIDLKSDDLWNCSWRILALVVSIPSYPSETSGELWCHLKTGIRRANLVQWVVSLKEPFHIFGGGWVGGGDLPRFIPSPQPSCGSLSHWNWIWPWKQVSVSSVPNYVPTSKSAYITYLNRKQQNILDLRPLPKH